MSAKDLYNTQSVFKRLTQVMHYGFTDGFFSPQRPIPAQEPQTAGRQFDYRPGFNLDLKPRRESGLGFEELRSFANNYDILRLIIETRKDQVAAFDWSIVAKDQVAGKNPTTDQQAHIDAAMDLFKRPDGRLTWHAWLRGVLEDSFVLDANVFWPVYQGKKLLRLESIDPSTIMKFIDESGRQPEPPLPAYRQVLKGVSASEYTKDELMYFIRNIRNNTVYGYSPVEQTLMTVNIGLRREVSQLQFFTQGNIPEAIAGVPDTWTPAQIAAFQSGWDQMFEGDTGARRQMKFVPNDASKILMLKGADALLKNEFDEWIVRIMCYAFSVPPTPFVKQVNRATAESSAEEARSEGLQPLLDYLKDMFDEVLRRCMGFDDVEFMWNMEQEQDAATQQTIDLGYIEHGVWGIDDVRERMGMKALKVPPMIWVAGKGPIPVSMFVDGSALDLIAPKPTDPADEGPPKPGDKKPTAGKPKPGAAKKPAKKLEQEGSLSKEEPFRKTKRFYHPVGKTYRASRQYVTKAVTRDASTHSGGDSSES